MVKVDKLLISGLIGMILFCNEQVQGQQLVEESLIRQYENADTDSVRVVKIGQLADYYFAVKNFSSGDSLIEKQIMLAEASLNPNLILKAYFENAGYNSTGTFTKDRSQITKDYIERALDYAKAGNYTDYVAMANSNNALLNNAEGAIDKAFKNASLGYTTSLNTSNDSAKVYCAIVLGNIYLSRSDILTAFKTYTNALNIATENKNKLLLPLVYHAIANLYKKLNKTEISKTYVNRSRAINEKEKNIAGLVNDYIFLAKLSNYTAARQHLQQSIELADQLQSLPLKIEAERIFFSYMLTMEKPSFTLKYLDEHKELEKLFINSGPDYLNWMKAEVYLYGGAPDSALHYFKKAENSFNVGYDLTSKKNFFGEVAYCYKQLNKTDEALRYYLKLHDLSIATADLENLKSNSKTLKSLYQQKGDYKLALEYGNLYEKYKDSSDILGKERDLAILEIENETKEQERRAEQAALALNRKYNLQYMLITIIIATAFVLLIMIGMFKVSTTMIRIMGFLSLIFLFEFIILILDKWIHHLTHGEPWKIWLIKIGIISFLLPFHHIVEHKLIRYLLSRHLITVRSRLSISKLLGKKKKPLPEKNNEEEASVDEDIF